MITYNRPTYVALSLPRLLECADDHTRIWVWHNGNDQETIDTVRSFLNHPRFYRFYQSEENLKLTAPTNWLWSNSDSAYIGKVDDDTLVPDGWTECLRQAHEDVPRFGAIGCWTFPECDYKPDLAAKKLSRYKGHYIIEHPWMAGSGYIMKRNCVLQCGLLVDGESFPQYCVRAAWLGWIHGWYYPLLKAEHMDDPRSSHSMIRTDQDLARCGPLTALKNNALSVNAYTNLIRRTAVSVQQTPKKAGKMFWIRSQFWKFRNRLYNYVLKGAII
jgi:hypothetical protein